MPDIDAKKIEELLPRLYRLGGYQCMTKGRHLSKYVSLVY